MVTSQHSMWTGKFRQLVYAKQNLPLILGMGVSCIQSCSLIAGLFSGMGFQALLPKGKRVD